MKIIAHTTKCLQCNTWNTGVDYCVHCNALINAKMLEELAQEEKKKAYANRPKSSADRALERIKNSQNWFVKGCYIVFHSIWLAFVSIVTFFMALMALSPG